ncbi:MAG TPA: alpha/beta hydrolase, partial [Anaerolineae bacterium]
MLAVEVNGAQLAYEAQGEGEPLVFVHGSLEDYRSWHGQMARFAERFHVVSYSRRYHYPNAPAGDRRDYSAALHAEDLAGLIRALDLGPRVHLVTSSYGGYVSLVMAARHPELVRSMVLG